MGDTVGRGTTVHDLAATARGRRISLGLTQAKVAETIGVSRKWVVEFEAGNPSAELRLVLKLFSALGIPVSTTPATDVAGKDATPAIDLDAVMEEYERR